MKLESLNQTMFEQISFEQMGTIQGGAGNSITCIYSTGSCGCVDSSDVD